MTFGMACVLAVLGMFPGAGPQSEAGSAAVLPLEAKNGVSPDVAELLTGNLVTRLGDSGKFTRVVGTKEIEALLGYEKQKQLLQCESQSCLAELAGAMGVEYVVLGTVGRLGKMWLFNATLVNTSRGEAVARVSKSVSGEEDALVAALESVVATLVAGVPASARPAGNNAPQASPAATPPGAPRAPETAAAVGGGPTPAQANPVPVTSTAKASPAAPPAEPSKSGGRRANPMGLALMSVGGAGMGLGGLALVVSVGGALVGAGALAALVGNVFYLVSAGRGVTTAALAAAYAGPLGAGALVLVALLSAGVGAGLLVAGVVLK
jgi:hypothetical protein